MTRARPRLIVLVGPKGSGKTSIGRRLGERPGVLFIEVEAVAKGVLAEMGGVIDERYAARAFDAIFEHVCARADEAPTLVMETTGAADSASHLIDRLRARFNVVLVRITASAARCDERMAARDPAPQIPVDPVMVRAMFERTAALDWPFALTVDNDSGRTREEVAAEIERCLPSEGPA